VPPDEPGKEKLISLDGMAVPTFGKFSSVLNTLTDPPELNIFALALPLEWLSPPALIPIFVIRIWFISLLPLLAAGAEGAVRDV
jgi:hypothetical protein